MKRNILFIGIFLCLNAVGLSQCSVNPFIESNYDLDAKFLALREILSDPSDPDYDNPFLPQARVTPYIEKLSAIYENPINEPIIDSLFNEFQFLKENKSENMHFLLILTEKCERMLLCHIELSETI